MQVRPLWLIDQPDISNRVVHLTGRTGQANADAGPAIAAMSAQERLEVILTERRIRAYPPFYSLGHPCVCFSEATPAGIDRLITGPTRRYEPWGLGFSKQFVFDRGGGPAYYVRGNHWTALAALPPSVSALATLYWPGADPTEPAEALPHPLGRVSQFAHEREWRIAVAPPADSVTFSVTDLAFVIAPSAEWLQDLPDLLGVAEAAIGHIARVFGPVPEEAQAAENEDDYALRLALGLDPWDPL